MSEDLTQQQLRPFTDVVLQHLAGSSDATPGSSSSSRGRGAKRAAARSLLEAHTTVFQSALDLELQEEWQEAEERLQVGDGAHVCMYVGWGVVLTGLRPAPGPGADEGGDLVRCTPRCCLLLWVWRS